jgi:hypothetical protein
MSDKRISLQRFKEPSTWRALVAMLTALGVNIAPELQEAIITIGLVMYGLINGLRKEPPAIATEKDRGGKHVMQESGFARPPAMAVILAMCLVVGACAAWQARPTVCDIESCETSRICQGLAEIKMIPEDVDLLFSAVNAVAIRQDPLKKQVALAVVESAEHLLTMPQSYKEFRQKLVEFVPAGYSLLFVFSDYFYPLLDVDYLISQCDKQILLDRLGNARTVIEGVGTVAGSGDRAPRM